MHRASYTTIAACEVVPWRRALYSQNNPGVHVYANVTTLTAKRLIRDGVGLPDIIVGSPPCQDISSANTKGKGVDGERSGLYFEAVRLINECRPRWYALENSANLRTRGADRVIDALEAIGYTCWPFVVSAGDVGANHERKRSWLIGFDADSQSFGHGCRWTWGHRPHGDGAAPDARGDVGNASQDGCGQGRARGRIEPIEGLSVEACGDVPNPNGQGQPDRSINGEMGRSQSTSQPTSEPWADWNGGLAHHLRVDDGLSAWVAQSRIAVGGPRGTVAASLIVEAFGDAVLPQIPEAIGRAIMRVEMALALVANDNAPQSTKPQAKKAAA